MDKTSPENNRKVPYLKVVPGILADNLEILISNFCEKQMLNVFQTKTFAEFWQQLAFNRVCVAQRCCWMLTVAQKPSSRWLWKGLFFQSWFAAFQFVSPPCCSLVRGCCSQMETAEMIKLPTNYFRPAFFFFVFFFQRDNMPPKLFSDVSGAVSLWCNLGHR